MAAENTVHLVPAQPADVDVVADLWVELVRDQRTHGSELLGAANRAVVRDSFAQAAVAGELLLARESDDLLGFVSFSLDHGRYERERTRGTVTNLFVVPERRGEGIGSRLLDAAERALHGAGATTITLEAMAENERARAFYRTRGYAPHRVTYTKDVETVDPDGTAGENDDDGAPDGG
ncbi:GNAT family N-acetyltransferase [Halorubrum vacuolatum]|uniref:Acetyltransferase, GNAT family n=1 Tax=Halorubrum vacuolatum TaxID=63740 RepID=A0A238V9M7_HALVU|nr:GNAT family N-acetyltransferase [Halorubrum vacuolatum]SNR30834.1 Acetyltransferase, GNAT family [Halorubrum vacuolatum]